MKWFLPLLLVGNLFQQDKLVISREQKTNLRKILRILASYDIKYGQFWTPLDESKPIKMDCSGTTQYIYKTVLGISLPRTSYDQYLAVKNSGNLQEPPKTIDGKIDIDKLRAMLKTGDLLFWINTHSDIPKDRNPPVGHVMIYLGRDKLGVMKAGGANTFGRGEKVLKGGVDIFTFDPNQKIGCVKDNTGRCKLESEFIGFGRPGR